MNKRTLTLIVAGLGIWLCGGCAWNKSGKSSWSLNNLLGGKNDGKSALDNRRGEEAYDVFGEANPDRIMLADLGPGRIWTTLQTRFSGAQDRSAAEEFFAAGKQHYDEGIRLWDEDPNGEETANQFRKAAAKFEIAGDRWSDSALEQDALFMQGEAHFFANQYVLANRAYEVLLSRYPGTSKLDLVEVRRFEIAQYWLALSRQKKAWGTNLALGDSTRPMNDLAGQARRIFHRIRLDDPTGKIADDATLALANAFFEAKLYADAADAYEDLRRTYPGSPHQFHAHIFELRARLASYRGPNFDGTDLEKADQLMKDIVRLFPNEAKKEREYLAREGKRIRNMLAERDWTIGEYYRRRGENRAASQYYAQVARDYADTEFATDASQYVADLEGKPPVPPQKAEWLVNLFPEKERIKPLIAAGDNESIWR